MFYDKLLYLLIHTHTHTHTHTHIYIYIYIYLLINIKNSGKSETVHWYWPVSEIYRIAGQIGTTSGTVLTPLLWTLGSRQLTMKREPFSATNFVLFSSSVVFVPFCFNVPKNDSCVCIDPCHSFSKHIIFQGYKKVYFRD